MNEIYGNKINPLIARAVEAGRAYPHLLADAKRAAALLPGGHGRKRPGTGDEFWQFRPARDGDPARSIDWRCSARYDGQFVREKEWRVANSIHFWADRSASMTFAGNRKSQSKADRACLLALAASILLVRAEERVGLAEHASGTGWRQIERMATALLTFDTVEYGIPPIMELRRGSLVVLISDFLGPWEQIEDSLRSISGREVSGILIQIVDPVEEKFPFDGRTVFESMAGSVTFETKRARGLRDGYLERFKLRDARIGDLASGLGWLRLRHSTADSVNSGLLWMYGTLGSNR